MKKVFGLLLVVMFLVSLRPIPISGATSTTTKVDNTKTKIVFGFWPSWANSLYSPQWNSLTHIAYFSVPAIPNGDLNISQLNYKYWEIHNEAQKHNIKVIITITAFNPQIQDEILATHADNFVENVYNIIKHYQADGVILDFENGHEWNSVYPFLNNKYLMEQLLKKLYFKLHPKYQVFICVSGWIEEMYRNKNIAQYIDGVFLMAYDFHVSQYDQDPKKEYAHYTGPVAPYDKVTRAVERLEEYYPKNKIILGVPLYGYKWEAFSPMPYAERVPSNGSSIKMYKALLEASKYGKKWDPKSKTPWYEYPSNNTTNCKYYYKTDNGKIVCRWYQVWYEDMESLGIKFDYIISERLAGVGFWALSYEGNKQSRSWNEFWSLVRSKFWSPQISISEISFGNNVSKYLPGDTVTFDIKVVGPKGNPIDAIVKFHVEGSSQVYNMKRITEGIYQGTFTIPNSFSPGIYQVHITAENPEYGKDNASAIFIVIKPVLISPSSKKPAYVGSFDNPRPFYIKLSTGVPYIDASKLLKKIWIDHRLTSKFEYLGTDSNGYSIYKVYTPPVNNEGKYDLTIELSNGLEITEKDTIIYSLSDNIDVVLVIDSSGSMHSYDGYWKGSDDNDLRLKAAKMLVDSMDKGDGVAVVDFDRNVRYYPPDGRLLYISSAEDRNRLKSFIDTIDASGGTYIGVGLKAAYDILSNAQDNYPKYVMLLTDGDDNWGDPYNPITVAKWFRDKGWKVYTIGLTSGWYTLENRPFLNSDLLMKIADITGGKYYEARKAEVLLKIYNSIKGMITNRNTLGSESIELKPGESTTRSVLVDPTVRTAEFSIAWSGSKFNLTLITPNGSVITPEIAQSNSNLTYTKGDTYAIYEVKNPLPGEWKMNITAVDVSENGENVTAMVLADTNLTVDLFTEKNTYKLGEPIKLIGVLTRNGDPVKGNINATIVKPDGNIDYLELDNNKNGIYYTYYIPKEAGSYTITLKASGEVNGVPFMRQTTFSVYVLNEPISTKFKASAIGFNFSTVSGKIINLDFTINSAIQDIARIGVTSLSDGKDSIAINYTSYPHVISLTPNESVPVHVALKIPFNTRTGTYKGKILIQGTNSVLTIPIEITVRPRLLEAPDDIGLYSTDVNVDNIEVYEISKDTLKQIIGNVPEVKNLRAFVITSTGFGHFKLEINNVSDINQIKVFQYDFDNRKWRQMPFERGSIILPFSVNGFDLSVIVIGSIPTLVSKGENLYTNIITLSYVWTNWFFKYYDEFNALYQNATMLNINNKSLQKALELHNNATELIEDAWRSNDLNTIRQKLWRGTPLPVPKFWEIRKAYLLEKEAVKILREAIGEH